ncbi:DUF6389 family protein [Achromobacter aegrifaciens]|uniref:DUF6389 family protein n=1 Tax=Achromobacter aegrifaciens TaxID=1287736 RepID=UPI0027B937EB|nr:DUF6389 family protein [Achromobacter aegrifaciens]WLW60680.1 DUF6389 family protein [Achromobacter aegrifaciens]
MTQSEYIAELLRILRAHDAAARATLTALIAALPPKAREIHFVVFPDQDGEGTFSVVASLEGPDLFVLNKAIEGHRYLFDVRHTEDGIEPEVPLFASGEAGFNVQDVIVDTAMQWVAELWETSGHGHSPLPGLVYGEEGYGTLEPLALPA